MSLSRLERPLCCLIVFGIIYSFLLTYFTPEHLLSSTVTTGGDTASHYVTAHYLIHTLLPQGGIIGWMPGNYAGFPLFQFYFPLPFLLMALLNILLPLQIAFKLVTILGIFLLPICAFYGLRLLGFRFEVSLTGAVFSLPFLFMTANSMWGGNIPSTLAGEFAYGIGFALLYVYLGSFYRGITENRYAVRNALLLAAIGLCHGYTLLFAVFATTFFLFTTEDFLQKTWYYLKVNGIAFLLLGFWIIQLLWFMPYTTRFNFVWVLKSILQVFPPILLPVVALAAAGAVFSLVRVLRHRKPVRRTGRSFLWFVCLLAAAFYLVAYNLNVVDIRFIPFIQFTLMLLGAVGLGDLISRARFQWLAPVFLTVLTVLLVRGQVGYIPNWIAWNYSGFEKKAVWPRFKALNDHLKGTCADPRVVYEHDVKHEAAGTIRAFEMLPYFSGRSTLEGLYIQATVTSPFVFYVQSEISEKPSTPLPDYNYSRVNLERGIKHLELFNVSHLVVVTDKLRKALAAQEGIVQEAAFPPYSLYRLENNANQYVSVLETEPLLLITKDWRSEAFQWFRKSDLETFVAFKGELEPEDSKYFTRIAHGRWTDDLMAGLQEDPAGGDNRVSKTAGRVEETVRPQEISFRTTQVGRPHLIRVSYHPNWHVEGADQIYAASPSFMMVFPSQEHVRLYFGPSFPNYLGYVLTLLGVVSVLCFLVFPGLVAGAEAKILNAAGTVVGRRFSDPARTRRWFRWMVVAAVCAAAGFVLLAHQDDAITAQKRGFSYYQQGDYARAREVFQAAMTAFPYSPVIDQTAFHYAVSYFKEENWAQALEAFQQMADDYPESRMYSEVLYHIGICRLRLNQREEAVALFKRIVREFRGDRWAVHARERLLDLKEDPR